MRELPKLEKINLGNQTIEVRVVDNIFFEDNIMIISKVISDMIVQHGIPAVDALKCFYKNE